ncbi:uncharacterized protein LOC100903639 [Galendromus occidentalis]|uniref:Uncharacterized protein LOC100903639 n=1 Tax=Galendromus occidentalis TaxID=34638 RepID=A0AAJ6VW09_9ACAR|nr:uncharacterized protein LOC100903639 [Galendromus occidentalis]
MPHSEGATSIPGPSGEQSQDPPSDIDAKPPSVALLKNQIRVRPSQLTRINNRVASVLANQIPQEYDDIVTLEAELNQVLENYTNLFEKWQPFLEVDPDPKKMDEEFDEHIRYDAESGDNLASLRNRLSSMRRELGIPSPLLSESPRPSQAVEGSSSGTFYSETAAGPHSPGASPQPDPNQANILTPVKNPEKKVPKFNGDLVKFREWWKLFDYYVDCRQMDTTEKCRILKWSLHGKALGSVCHLDIGDENYELMKDILQDSFGRSDAAKTQLSQRVHALCYVKDIAKPSKFIHFVSQKAQTIRSLVAHGDTFDKISSAYSPMILCCISYDLRVEFVTEWEKRANDDTPKLEALLKFLEEKKARFESSERHGRFLNISKGSGSNSHSSDNRPESKEGKSQGRDYGHNLRSQFSFAGATSQVDHSCIFCGKNHESSKCTTKMSPEDRRKRCADQNACLRCLLRDHRAKTCRAKVKNCSKCAGRHSELVCTGSQLATAAGVEAQIAAAGCQSQSATPVALLQTAYVYVVNGPKRVVCRALLDPGAMRSLVSDRIVEELGIKASSTEAISLHGIAGTVTEIKKVDTCHLKLQSRFSKKSTTISCLRIPRVIKGNIPHASSLKGFHPIADSKKENFPEEVDLLIANDWLHLVYSGQERVSFTRIGSLFACPTIFGWVCCGSDADGSNQIRNSVFTSSAVVQHVVAASGIQKAPAVQREERHANLELLWDTDIIGIESPLPPDAERTGEELIKFFKDTVKRTEDGRYSVSLPFRDNVSTLGDNQKISFSRLLAFLKSAKKDPSLLKAVDKEIRKYIDSGFAEQADPREPGERAHYLPILAVAKKSLSEASERKIRIVKDCGCRSKEEAALNDVLEKGPNLLPDILSVLNNFRKSPIVIVADVQQALMQTLINEDHRKFLRFFWPLGISEDPEAPIREYWATVLDFGLSCSPFLHCQVLRHHLDWSIEKFPGKADILRGIRDTFFMDDFCAGASSIKEAKETTGLIIDVFSSGHFPLDKWAANNKLVADYISRIVGPDRSVSASNTRGKFMGISWNQVSDFLFIDVDPVVAFLESGPITKRQLLKGLSQVFDPLGLIAPIAIALKMILQTIWSRKIDWDSTLTDDL